MKKHRFSALLAAAAFVFSLSAPALAFRFGVWEVASEADAARVKDSIYIADAIERYYKLKHHYPLIDHVQPEFIKVAITSGKAPDVGGLIPVEKLEKELSDALGRTIKLPRDPKDNGQNVYFYTSNGQDYYVASMLEKYMPYTRPIETDRNALHISSRPSKEDNATSLNEMRRFVFKGLQNPDLQKKLVEAVKNKDYTAASDAWQQGAYLNPPCNFSESCKPLSIAADMGDVQMVDFLLQNGADPNGLGLYQDVPMITAMKAKHPLVAVLLLEGGADPNYANAFGVTPFIGAVHDGHDELVNQMLASSAKLDEHYQQNNSQAQDDEFGERPLEAAINTKNEKMVALLLKAGANAKLTGQNDTKLVDLAVASGDEKIARLVKDAAAK